MGHPRRSEVARNIIHLLITDGKLSGQDLYEKARQQTGVDAESFAEAIGLLATSGRIRVKASPKKISNFGRYMLAYEFSWPSWFVVVLTSALVLLVYLLPDAYPWQAGRFLIGAAFVLLVPGFSLEHLLFQDGLRRDPYVRAAIVLGLSLSVIPLVGLVLSYSVGFFLQSTVSVLAAISVLAILVGSYRHYLKLSTV